MTNEQASVGITAAGLLLLPLELWLQVALYADAHAVLRLCTASRAFWCVLANAQSLWKRLYQATFSEAASERFWLTAYQSRLARSQKTSFEHVHVDWRRALIARMQTEANWRLGRCVQRSCLMHESRQQHKSWSLAKFTPNELLLRNCTSRVLHAIPTTAVNVAYTPLPILLDDASSDEQIAANIYDAGDRCALLYARMSHQLGLRLWVRRSIDGPAHKLAQGVVGLDKCGRWVLAFQEVYCTLDAEIKSHWLLLDAEGDFPPQHLIALDAFDYKEYAAGRVSDADAEDTEIAAILGQHYQSACIMSANNDCVIICAVSVSWTWLYWKVIKVTFDHNISKAHLSHDQEHHASMSCCCVRTLNTGRLNVQNGYMSMERLIVYALGGGYVYVQGLDNRRLLIVILAMGASDASSATQSAEADVHSSLHKFQHGWLDTTTQSLAMVLTHRQLLVTMLRDTERQNGGGWPTRLLRFHDGSLAASYLLPDHDTIDHILGDLAVLTVRHENGYRLVLFDAFAGVTVRKIHSAAGNPHINQPRISPVYLFTGWQESEKRHGNNEEDSGLLPLKQNERAQPFLRHIKWLDFMPDFDKSA
ncbi:hypothetical protein THASP1DRAFT_31332 [Thamnocephalis sphaerospora]|uniref:F-box domain-containing protein n=1 Tax=Thamnocephalis sphaerospora TaxID=78915 RepID=A0A4P9XLZ6_9FUNG|nr:hypothetical protein THASP1DRAFT_31332 [Thamnocephalis sphaerospora]|eukprot:RKP06856.1 hypothetical protein THASP1DRAFT_31332 [Thamnocephalis sphaerospora]